MIVPAESTILERPAAEPPACPEPEYEALSLLQAAFPADQESGLLKLAALRMMPDLFALLGEHYDWGREAERAELESEEARLRVWADTLAATLDDLAQRDEQVRERELALTAREHADTTPEAADHARGLDRLNRPGPASAAVWIVAVVAAAACVVMWWPR